MKGPGVKALWMLPLVLFLGLAAFMAANLGKPQQTVVMSRMIGKPVPDFAFPGLAGGVGLSRADLARGGGPVLVNIFASWCLPCAVEAPQLKALQAKGAVVHGIAIRDTDDNAGAFLTKYGNPFSRVGMDPEGRIMLALGASGVPETYVVDAKGIIRFQHLGEIRPEHVPILLAQLEKAR